MVSIIVALLILGLVLYLINTLPIDQGIKNVIHVIVVVLIIVWLLQHFAGLPSMPLMK